MQRHRHKRSIISIWAVPVLLFLVTGCRHTQLSHFDNRAFAPLYELTLSESAWLAVDSCDTGYHALVEIELDPLPRTMHTDRALMPSRPLPLTLVYDSGKSAAMSFGRLQGPICRTVSDWPKGYGDGVDPDPVTSCIYLYRAEFKLKSLPAKNQDFILKHGNRSFLLARR